ncbi:MAG: IS66 family insertion sequence element accessory protein TnpB [bacterium]|nr:IS66 family insertion sequence element accessory protein TnpB [bacterium]
MLTFSGRRIFLVTGATDMRKSFNGLARIAREQLDATPASRDLFLFCNRGRNRLKALVYDESGVWVLAKRLDEGTFSWPSEVGESNYVEYREEELALLLRGFDAKSLTARRWRRRADH